MNGTELLQHVSPDENPGCGTLFRYRGVRCSQSRRVFRALDRLHEVTWSRPVERIVEVGTLYGAFTRILRDHDVSRKAEVYSFDVKDTLVDPVPDVSLLLGDVFAEPQLSTLADLIQRPGRCFVFCDGGDKEREVRELCRFLKPEDVVLCHDYVKDPGAWVADPKDWNVGQYESSYSNIKDALEAAHCEPFLELEMQRAVWGCFIRR